MCTIILFLCTHCYLIYLTSCCCCHYCYSSYCCFCYCCCSCCTIAAYRYVYLQLYTQIVYTELIQQAFFITHCKCIYYCVTGWWSVWLAVWLTAKKSRWNGLLRMFKCRFRDKQVYTIVLILVLFRTYKY